MAGGRTSFEVQTAQGGRWAAKEICGTEEDALALARRLLGAKALEGVRVIRNWLRSDGQITETEIFCETRRVEEDAPIHVASIETPPPLCRAVDDYFGPASRDAIGRLFRTYLEKMLLTPTELLHSYKELRRLQEKDTLVPAAVDRVAQLQTPEGGDARARARAIFKAIDDITARARRIESVQVPPPGARLGEILPRLTALAPEEEVGYLALTALSRELIGVRNWIGKLDRLCALAAGEPDPAALGLLDSAIADLLASSVVQDVLGAQPSLGAAICAMVDLAQGRLDPVHSQVAQEAATLNRLLGAGQLPQSQAVLVDRAHRQIRSANPLCRTQPEKEGDEFRRLVDRLLGPEGFLYGAETAEALTMRQTRMVEQGGAAGRRAACAAAFHAMPDRAAGVIYLCEVLPSPLGQENAATLAELMDSVVRCRGMIELALRTLPPKERMLRATRAHRVVLGSAFPPELRTRTAQAIDVALERYLMQEHIIDKLDHPDTALRERAVRLVQFCAAGVLPEGRALTRARQRVRDLLRQPNFDLHFIEGLADPQEALRDFHRLLGRAGFR